MATKSSSRKAPAKGRQTQRKPASNKTTTTRNTKNTFQKTTGFSDYFHAFSKTKLFAPLMTVLGIIVGICFDLLISWNNYDRFFLILGIELIIIASLWIGLLLLKLGTDVMNEE